MRAVSAHPICVSEGAAAVHALSQRFHAVFSRPRVRNEGVFWAGLVTEALPSTQITTYLLECRKGESFV
jgi:hypothetical protein